MASTTLSEWLDRNAHRAFPFVEDSDLSCGDGRVLPLSAVLDARVCLFSGDARGDVRLRSVSAGPSLSVTLLVDGSELVLSGAGNVLMSLGEDVSARLVCSPEGLSGDYVLKTPAKILESRVLCIPCGIGVDRLQVGDKTATGDIRVQDGHNTTLDIVGGRLVLKVGYGLGKGPVCTGGHADRGALLRYLCGQKADSDGNIQLVGDEGVSVSAGTYKGIPAVIVSTSGPVNNFVY